MTAADLLVVGAGPAGVAAAVTAADRGMRTVVCDRAVFPRDKTCGDGLTAGALRLLEELGLDLGDLPAYGTVREVLIVAPGGRRVVLPMPADGEHGGIVPRVDLDAALVRLARGRGVEVVEGAPLEELTTEGTAVHARLGGGRSVHAPWVVAADGHFSRVRRLLAAGGPRPRFGEYHAFREYWTGVDQPRLTVLFEADLLPGYAWVFPLGGGRANVGFGVPRAGAAGGRPGGRELAALARDVFDRPSLRALLGPDAAPDGPRRAWPIPSRLDRAGLAAGRVLFAGDAAGAVDALTGEGIAQALETGRLAADAVAGGGAPAAVRDRYRRAVDRALGRDLRLAAVLRRVMASPRLADASVAAAGLTPWTRRHFARWMFEDYPRALVVTPDRWRRGVLTPPGAYAGRRQGAA